MQTEQALTGRMSALFHQPVRWLLFEFGASYYARKQERGCEWDLRRTFLAFLRLPQGARVLDVGCGPGHLACELARRGHPTTGVDPGWRLLRIARRLSRRQDLAIHFERARGEKLPFAEENFDCALATAVVSWVARPERVLAEMARVTRPGGVVALLDPHPSLSVAAMHRYCERQGISPVETRKLVAWAHASLRVARWQEVELRARFAAAGLVSFESARHLDGMVWFAKAIRERTP